ncbi:MAG: NERD domain-containing protein [Candidatus Magasanikbacteria bacterium]
MEKNYLEKNIKHFSRREFFYQFLLALVPYYLGVKIGVKQSWGNLMIGILLGFIVVIFLYLRDHSVKNLKNYTKGLKLEKQLQKKLDTMNITYEKNLKTNNGDLDLLIQKNNNYYGIEIKNWSGTVEWKNNLLMSGIYDKTDILKKLLGSCLFIKNSKFGENPKIFVKPVLVFGYETNLKIPNNKIIFHNIEILIFSIQDLPQNLN